MTGVRCAISQPHYLPWLPYLARMDAVDLFILLDNVQFERHNWQNRAQIVGPGGVQWLTVPVLRPWWQPINSVKVCNTSPWGRTHWRTLVSNYNSAPYFRNYRDAFHDGLMGRSWQTLHEVDRHFVLLIKDAFGLQCSVRLASEFSVPAVGNERLVGLCRAVGATVYLSGVGGPNEARDRLFAEAGIQIEHQRMRIPSYRQVFPKRFIPCVSAVDFLFNCGRKGWDEWTTGR